MILTIVAWKEICGYIFIAIAGFLCGIGHERIRQDSDDDED